MALNTGLKFKTQASITALEDWLEANCAGAWEVELDAICTTLDGQKKVSVFFENDADRDAFKVACKTIK